MNGCGLQGKGWVDERMAERTRNMEKNGTEVFLLMVGKQF